MSRKRDVLISSFILIPLLLSGCAPSWFAKWADRDAYNTISEGQNSVLGRDDKLDISYNPVDCDAYLTGTKDENDKDVQVLTLEDALKVAFRNNRTYQSRKETLYKSALSFATNSRGWETLLPSGSVSSDAEMSTTERGSSNRFINADSSYSLTKRLVGGGLLTLGASLDFVTHFAGLGDTEVGSLIEGSFTQPLLQGAWRGLAYEDQHRRERDFLIEVYEFDRYRQTFAVEMMQKYYAILTLKDFLENSRTNVQRLNTAYLRTKTMVQGGQLNRTQEDQAEQDLLSAQISFEQSQLAYSNQLDNLKITLGLPISKDLQLDYPGALKRLNQLGPQELPFSEMIAIETSKITDTALLRARANTRDAEKDLEIAADNFNPQLDLVLDANVAGTDKTRPGRIQTHRHHRSARLEFNYNLDQTANRDTYRKAIISRDSSRRSLTEAEDSAALNVRNSFRSLKQSRQSFFLQKKSVQIAQRRTKLIAIQRQQGQASTRDVLEAEDALNKSLNGLTSSLVNYTITRLEFLASLGMLDVDQEGDLTERDEPFGYNRLQDRYQYLTNGKYVKNDSVNIRKKDKETTRYKQDKSKEKSDEQ